MGDAAVRYDGFSWSDYRRWPDDERWEIVDGQAYAMSPSPGYWHQSICAALTASLYTYFADKPCLMLPAPMDVKLSDHDVVQPDLLVVCDKDKIRATHVEGTPDLVVEVLSPSTALLDRSHKLRLYARSGVREYWIVKPYPAWIEVLQLDGDSYRVRHVFRKEDTLRSPLFPGLEIPLEPVFDFPIPPEEQIDMVKEGSPPYGRENNAGAPSDP